MIPEEERLALPILDFHLDLGAAVHNLATMTLRRDDVQVVLYQGQIRIGEASKHHEDLERVGTLQVEPSADDFRTAARLLGAIK